MLEGAFKMDLLGICEVQYANNLFSKKSLVLRTDRKINSDKPLIAFFKDDVNKVMAMKIYNDINIESMQSNPNAGAKIRTDIHFDVTHLQSIIDTLRDFVSTVDEIQDDAPRKNYNPTGMEHADGLRLGITEDITYLPVSITCNYGTVGFSITKATRMYIDAEQYPSKRYHLGFDMKNATETSTIDEENNFVIYIDYSNLKRFLYSIIVAQGKLL